MLYNNLRPLMLFILILYFAPSSALAQTDTTLHNALQSEIKALKQEVKDYEHRFDVLEKGLDDITWFQPLGDVAHIDKVRLTSTPRWKAKDVNDLQTTNFSSILMCLFLDLLMEIKSIL